MKAFALCFLAFAILLFSCKPTKTEDNITKSTIDIPKGFQLDTLYSPGIHDQGSWVALAQGEGNLMYSSDQYGNLYRFPMPNLGEKLDPADVDSIALNIGDAQGLLWAFNSLYVSVNKRWKEGVVHGSGVYRLRDSDSDGELDKLETLLKLDGSGEHGPHSLVLSPDGESIYFIAGNHTLVPENITENSRIPNNWGNDNLLTPYLDARGHANDIKAPGGWIAKMDPEGKDWEIISVGYRNPYDMGFNVDGELFAYDADMEWDMGMPWYRPTRICHVTSGSEFGWRTGTGKWPTYYPDALPAVVDLNQGSPTGVVMSHNLDFPARFQSGLFACDWSFGTMYYVDLTPSGSSYTGKAEEFLSGTPLPLTDAIAGKDGNLYFATGGRRLESHLFRIRYTGSEKGSSSLVENEQGKGQRQLRKELESLHNRKAPGAIEKAWQHLDHEDRHIRYAARMVLEHIPVEQWKSKFSAEKSSAKIIQASIARIRQAGAEEKPGILNRLMGISMDDLDESSKLDMLRAYELLCIRMGRPDAKQSDRLSEMLNRQFPSSNDERNREMAELLVYLGHPEAVEKSIGLMDKHTRAKTNRNIMLADDVTDRSERYGPKIKQIVEKMPPAEAIYYGTLLSHANTGWSKPLYEKYFQWFYEVFGAEGGLSFKATMENVRMQAMEKIPEQDRAYFQELSGVYAPTAELTDLPKPKGPGQNYTNATAGKILRDGLKTYEGSIDAGKFVYKAALCETCHQMNGIGGNNGPDLTQLHTRFGWGSMLYAVISPHEEISDQYAHTLFSMKDGRKLAGRILKEGEEKIEIMPNPFTSTATVEFAKSEVESRRLSPISPMPPGLLNPLSEQEVLDLFAYLMSGGDPEHHYYGGEKGKEEIN